MKVDRSFFFQTKEKDKLQTSNSNIENLLHRLSTERPFQHFVEQSRDKEDKIRTTVNVRRITRFVANRLQIFFFSGPLRISKNSTNDFSRQQTHINFWKNIWWKLLTNSINVRSWAAIHSPNECENFSKLIDSSSLLVIFSQIYQTNLDDLQRLADVKATTLLNGRDEHSKRIQSQLEPKPNHLLVRLVSLISSRFDSIVRLWNIE